MRRSVDSESESHAIERRKTFRGSLCCSDTRGHAAALYGLVPAVLPASTEHGKRTFGVPQELGISCRFLSEIPAGDTGLPTPGLGGALVRRGAKRTSGRRGTTKRRQRSAVGWAAGSHSALIVPAKLANGSRPEPGEGSEASDHGTPLGKHDECLEIRQSCPRNRSG